MLCIVTELAWDGVTDMSGDSSVDEILLERHVCRGDGGDHNVCTGIPEGAGQISVVVCNLMVVDRAERRG